MIGTASFPPEGLMEGQRVEDRADIHDEATVLDAGRRHDRLKRMAFTSLGPDKKATPEPERLYTADDLVKAVEEARRLAAEEVESELRDVFARDLERRRVDLLSAINDQLDRHRSAFDDELNHLADMSQRLALELGEALIPRALERQPLADIADVLRATLARLTREPSIELRLPPDLIEAGGTLLADIAKETGFQGEVTTIADTTLGHGDAELRWRGGAVDRRMDRLRTEARDLAERWLLSVSEPDERLEAMSSATSLETSMPVMPPGRQHDAGSEQE